MKRFLLTIVVCCFLSAPSQAAHIKGGFFSYRYLGPGTFDPVNYNRYRVTLTIYMVCTPSPGQLTNPINFTIFNNAGVIYQNVSVPLTNQYTLGKNSDEPCISGNQQGCYYTVVVYDLSSVELPRSTGGYTISYQRCCRLGGIQNLIAPSSSTGNTFTIKIPGSSVAPGAETNSSPLFPVNDTAVVCAGSSFSYSFQASDTNGDSLAYSFCDAFAGGGQDPGTGPGSAAPDPAAPPPYFSVPYQSPFFGSQPMGPGVTIDPITGLINGIAPALTGEYVVCVCVSEYRNGVLLGITRKELHIQVKDCEPLDARLDPKPTTCDGFTVSFANDGTTPPGTEYFWTFGEPSSGIFNTSLSATPVHTYAAAGTYTITLKVSIAGLCLDSTISQINVFPGFYPGFTVTGSCYNNPFQFTDTTRTDYGTVNSWSWNFGDTGTLADTSHLQHPQWTYTSPGTKTVTLTVSNSKGCINTVSFPADVRDKPGINLAFNDTLICRNDAIQLNAGGTGVFSWTPLVNIINPNTGTPTVSPLSTTRYFVTLNDNGCINQDSVNVRVINAVSLQAMSDTTICQGDAVQLSASTNGLSFNWTPAAGLNNPNIINPLATVNATTTYTVRASIGSCSMTDQVVVTTVPYPIANAGPDPTICYNGSVQLNGTMNGVRHTWSPGSFLDNPNSLTPLASPPRTTQYILSAFDNLGCPKPGLDTIVVTVLPKVRAYAGRDTTVVVGQPLQFNGSGGINYAWSPAIGLSGTAIPNPIGVYDASLESIQYKLVVSDMAGCADSSFITVRIFQTKPTIFVPTAFTPNNDGLNDVVRPISAGIQQIKYFSIFNRGGQRVFNSTTDKAGWDGRFNGKDQANGVYVWMVQAIDYTGAAVFLKGTVTLIR